MPPATELPPTDLCVCIVGPHYPRPGGVSTQVEVMSRCLRADGVRVRSVDTNIRWLRKVGLLGRLLMPVAQLLTAPVRLRRGIVGAHVVHVHLASYWGFYLPMISVALACWRRRIPVVASFHGGKAALFAAKRPRLIVAFLRQLDALIVSSEFTGRVFEGLGFHPIVIPNLVELEHFQPHPPNETGVGRQPSLLWIKRFDDTGNPLLMVRAFAHIRAFLPGATLKMIGDGDLHEQVEALAAELQTPIDFARRVSFAELKASYAAADIFVSSSAYDNQPCTLLEASASGLPIVATAVGGVPDMVDDGVNALLAPADDPEALAQAVARIAQQPQFASQLGRAAIANSRAYTWPAIRPRLWAVYEQVLDRKLAQAADQPVASRKVAA